MCSLLFLSLLVVSAPKGQSGRRLYSLSRSFEFCRQKRLMAVFASQPDNQTPVYWISLMDGNSAQLAALWSELKYHNSYWLDAVTFRRDIHGPQKMNPNYFFSSATMRLTFFVFSWNISSIAWYGWSYNLVRIFMVPRRWTLMTLCQNVSLLYSVVWPNACSLSFAFYASLSMLTR